MPAKLIFLHNGVDRESIRLIHDLACDDQDETSLEPWIDRPGGHHKDAATLGGAAGIDGQIERVIAEAGAILYFLGPLGPGPYQESVESELVRRAIEQREREGRPLRFLPVLLKDGDLAGLPNWAEGRLVVNFDRRLRTAMRLWADIKLRLRASEGELDAEARGCPKPVSSSEAETLARELRTEPRASLTLFIGPYSYASGTGGDAPGPAAMTEKLLSLTVPDFGSVAMLPIAPWPSEAAQWLALARGQQQVRDLFLRQFRSVGGKPPLLADSIGFLASNWVRMQEGKKERSTGWHGLLLLTTRVDLAIEASLARDHSVAFTRMLPTLNGATTRFVDREYLVQQWPADPHWEPESGSIPASTTSVTNVQHGKLSEYPLDEAESVVLVKLCGSIDVPASLVLTAYDFFQKARDLQSLPKQLAETVKGSSQLLIGRGFASPLAQLVRAYVLERRQEGQKRIWVMPDAPDGASENEDILCQLELTLLKENERVFKDALDANVLARGSQADFIRHVAEGL